MLQYDTEGTLPSADNLDDDGTEDGAAGAGAGAGVGAGAAAGMMGADGSTAGYTVGSGDSGPSSRAPLSGVGPRTGPKSGATTASTGPRSAVPALFSPDMLLSHNSTLTCVAECIARRPPQRVLTAPSRRRRARYTHTDVKVDYATGVSAAMGHAAPDKSATGNPLHCDYHITRLKALDAATAEQHNIRPDIQVRGVHAVPVVVA